MKNTKKRLTSLLDKLMFIEAWHIIINGLREGNPIWLLIAFFDSFYQKFKNFLKRHNSK